MSPDSEYITFISYTTKLKINLCNFLAIWVVLSILMDTKSKDLQYVQNLQQVVDYYYNKCTAEAMTWLEQQASKILDVMYDSVTKHNFDSISDDVDRVSDAVETSKQHYERFNLYINFQTKSGHLTDPVREAIDLFEHTLDKTALVWFQTNRFKFKDLTTLKTMFLK